MDPINFEFKFSLKEYYDLVAENVRRTVLADPERFSLNSKQSLWFAGAMLTIYLSFKDFKSDLSLNAWIYVLLSLVLLLNWITSTSWGYRTVVPIVSCALAITTRKLGTTYKFQVDEKGILRSVRSQNILVPWDSVVHIHKYSHCYFLELKKGGLPILYRALYGDRMTAFEAAITKYLSNTK